MAVVKKRRSLVNPGKRRMSLKQKLHFGSAKVRAAARLALSKKRRNPAKKRRRNYGTPTGRSWSKRTAKKLGISLATRQKKRRSSKSKAKYAFVRGVKIRVNPGQRKRRAKARHRRKNVGTIISLGLAGLAGNPGRKRRKRTSNMARRRKRSNRARAHRRLSNPGVYRRKRSYGRRRRNPGVGQVGGLVKKALGVIGGAVATRYATQLVLGGKNMGVIGYVGNAIAAMALGWAAGSIFRSPDVGAMITLGGFTSLTLRVLQDMTPVGQFVNLSLSGAGKGGDYGMGIIENTTFYTPTVFQNNSMTQALVPQQIQSLVAASSSPAAGGSGAGMGNYRRRRAGRM